MQPLSCRWLTLCIGVQFTPLQFLMALQYSIDCGDGSKMLCHVKHRGLNLSAQPGVLMGMHQKATSPSSTDLHGSAKGGPACERVVCLHPLLACGPLEIFVMAFKAIQSCKKALFKINCWCEGETS